GTGILRSMLLVFNWPHFNRIPPSEHKLQIVA
ncbi:hypothetical protein V3C99_010172, partial [Haemonchus contortus]